MNVGPPSPQATTSSGLLATALPGVFSTQLTVSTPPTSVDEYFFFNSLVVGLPYSSMFCQFWLFFVFKFVVVLLLVVQGGTECLPMPPSWPEVSFFKKIQYYIRLFLVIFGLASNFGQNHDVSKASLITIHFFQVEKKDLRSTWTCN